MTEKDIPRPAAKAAEKSTDSPNDYYRRLRVGKTGVEMKEQDVAIKNTLEKEKDNIKEIAAKVGSRKISKMYLLGCGDSWFINIGVRYALESLLNITCEPVQALDYSLYHYLPTDEESIVIGISSSGTTEAITTSLDKARERGAFAIGISNTTGAEILNKYDGGIMIHATRKGWPTQASTAAMAALIQFGIYLSRQTNPDNKEAEELLKQLNKIPAVIEGVYQQHDEAMKKLAEEYVKASFVMFAGAGSNYAPAAFGAAKIKELCPINALAMPLEEFHHYRTLKDDDPFFLISPEGPGKKRALDTAEVGRYDGGKIFALVSEKDQEISKVAHAVFRLPEVDERLAPIIYSVPLHQFAYYLAMAKFEQNLGYPGSYITGGNNA